MPEHRIRLRGGWERESPGGGPPAPRLTLPLAAFPWEPGGVRLARSFQTPPLVPGRESLWLGLGSVPGLVSVTLNGRELARGPFGARPVRLPLGEGLPARNRLVLDVGPDPGGDALAPVSLWGDVALVILRGEGPAPDRLG